MGTFGGPNVWKISGEERLQHDQQFFQLKPVNGFITGEQARNFFLQSGLPSQLLAQIWNLADLNHDGKMDKKEFSIAMQLIKNKLKGFNIPPSLPDSMKIDPEPSVGTFGPTPLMGMPPMSAPLGGLGQLGGIAPVRPIGMPMTIPGMMPGGMGYGGSLSSSPVASMGPIVGGQPQRPASALAKPNVDWTMSQGTRLKFSQMFNNLDKQRVGSITGAHARNIMSSSGLPPAILAQIWNLSDLDKDGKLTCDEFCIAMHLIEMAKAGETNLPNTTPVELIPTSRQRTISTASVGSVGEIATGSGGGLSDLLGGSDQAEQRRNEALAAASFEDKRRMNFEKGQMELERRRQQLQEQEKRERDERERKDREEQEKRDRERMEIERRRQLEREKELARMREVEQQKADEYQKMMEQREAARRDLERQRQVEWEKQRVQELSAQRQRDQEAVCHLKQKQKNLTFQLQALNEKSAEVNGQITQMRDKIIAITSGIEHMKEGRDRKVADITLLQRQLQEQKVKLMQAVQQKQVIMERQKTVPMSDNNTIAESYRQVMHSYHNKEMNMESLKQSLTEMEKEQRQNLTTLDEKQKYLNDVKKEMESLRIANLELTSAVTEKQQTARSLLLQQNPTKQLYTTSTPSANGSAWPETGQPWGGSPEFSATSIAPTGGFVDDPIWGSSAQDSGWAADFDRQPSSGSDHVAITSTAGHSVVRFKALYEFSARADDELSFQPGDVIQVFRDYPAQEGWLAGQIHDKVGWFPKDYATELAADSTELVGASEDAWGGAVAPLDSIREESGTDSNSLVDERQAKPITLNGAFEAQKPIDNSGAPQQQVSPGDLVRLRSAKGDDSKVNANRQYAVTEGCLEAKALYPWKAKKEEHLTFNKGDVIKVLEQQEMFWRGELPNGNQGWFPKSYVKLINGPIIRRNSSRAQTPTHELDDQLTESQRGSGQEQTMQSVNENAPVEGEPFVAVYAFVAAESGDLGFNTGDVVYVIRKKGDWWTGRLADGTEGIFPANYVQPPEGATEEAHTNGGTSVAEVPAIKSPSVHSDVVSMTNSGSTHSQANPEVFQFPAATNGTSDSQPVGDVGGNRPDSRTSGTSAKKPSVEPVEMGKVIAPFTATASNQINLQPGEMVRITSKSPTGWWEGEIQRKDGGQDKLVGWFPGSYVKVISANKLSSELSRTGSVNSAHSATARGGSVSGVDKNENLLVALFDYVSQQDDELSLSAGDVLSLVEKVDDAWWKGTIVTSTNANGNEGKTGVFPFNYVKPYAGDIDLNPPRDRTSASPVSLGDGSESSVESRRKRNLAVKELIQTELNYQDDLKMVRDVFFKPLGSSGCLTGAELREITANWDELERITRDFCKELKRLRSEDSYEAVGNLVVSKLADLQGFVQFGELQQNSLDLLETKERKDPKFKTVYAQCCANPVTRGFKLDYYMHLPIARVTKYPLVVERILKYTSNAANLEPLQTALEGLKCLCSEVNRRATDVENLRMLHWCETHVKLEGLKPKLTFQSETHSLGYRRFLHSGILYKAKSSRMLVGLLFNDLLMLTIPDNTIDHPDSFKLTRTSDVNLTLYRQPLLLSKCSVTAGAQPGVTLPADSSEDCLLSVASKTFSVHLKAVSSNARLLWMKQMEKAIQGSREPKLGRSNSFQLATTTSSATDLSTRRMTTANVGRLGSGRLLIAVSGVEKLYIPDDLKEASCYAELSFGTDQIFRTSIADFNVKENLLVTQFLIEKDSQPTLRVGFYLERTFALDFVVGYVEMSLSDLMKESAFRKGPVERKIPMRHDMNATQHSFVIMKFDIQLFDRESP